MRRSVIVGALSVVLLTGFSGDVAFDRATSAAMAGISHAISSHDPCKAPKFSLEDSEALRAELRLVTRPGLHHDRTGMTPLQYAVLIDDVQALDRFVKLGYPIEGTDIHGITALNGAAQFGSTASVDWLIRHGASVNSRAGGQTTPLMAAIAWNQLATVRQLLAAGADPKATPHNGHSMLVYAFVCRDPKMIATLVEAGVPVDDKVRELAAKYGMKLD